MTLHLQQQPLQTLSSPQERIEKRVNDRNVYLLPSLPHPLSTKASNVPSKAASIEFTRRLFIRNPVHEVKRLSSAQAQPLEQNVSLCQTTLRVQTSIQGVALGYLKT